MSILNSIGNTPLVEIKNIWNYSNIRIFAKVEGMNPGGSIKDRVALNMIQQAIKRGDLKPGMEVLEATSGNTGIGLAMVCAALRYPCTLVMPLSVSEERRKLIKAFGATVINVEGNTDSAIRTVEEFILATSNVKQHRNKFYNPNQFDNPDNWKTHWLYTGPEITRQLQLYTKTLYVPNPDIFIASCGTTGTLIGCKTWFDYQSKKYFGDLRKKTKTVAVFPPRNSKIQGLKNLRFSKTPKIYNRKLIDKRVIANDEESFKMTQRLAREEGIFCGLSSGAAMCEAIRQAQKAESATNIVVILPDNGYRYISEGVF